MLNRDGRGVSEVIGFILIFSVLVTLLIINQVLIVPQANEEHEFNHHLEVSNNMGELRNAIMTAAATGGERSVGVTLGARYPPRVFAVNPPPPNGQLVTEPAGELAVSGVNVSQVCSQGEVDPITTKSLAYRPGYNHFDNFEAITYEQTFLVRSYRDGNVVSARRLIQENGTELERLNLQVLTGNVTESGTGLASVEINGSGQNRTTVAVDGSVTVTIASRFDAETWSSTLLEDADSLTNAVNTGGDVELTFATGGNLTVTCSAIGVGTDAPTPSVSPGSPDSGGDSSDEGDIHPSGEGELVLVDSGGGNSNSATVTFNNTASTSLNVTAVRIPFYYADQQDTATSVETFAGTDFQTDDGDLDIGSPLTDLESKVEFEYFESSDNPSITIEFAGDSNIQVEGDFFILMLEFESGETSTYFVAPPSQGDGNNQVLELAHQQPH